MKKYIQKGQAALLSIFLLGLISLLIGVSLLKTSYDASIRGRSGVNSLKAFYSAQSGVEEAMLQIQTHDFGYPGPDSFNIAIGEGSADVNVYGSENQRTIESTGYFGKYLRRIKVIMQNTQIKPGFSNAILAGQGGVVLRNQTLVTSKDGSGGNVYSNTYIRGAKNDYIPLTGDCKNSASKIDGSAYAVEIIDKLAVTDSGVCVLKEAHSGSIDYCWVKGDVFSPLTPSPVTCPFAGLWTNEDAPLEIALPDMGVDILKNYLSSKGDVFSGNCLADGSGSSHDCTNGTLELGNIIITGDFEKPSNIDIDISGPVWVKGNVIFNSQGTVGLTSEITEVSQIFVTDGTLISDSNVVYGSNGNAFLLFISAFDPGVDSQDVCNDGVTPAIEISSNSNSVLFYSMHGCIQINANSVFHGAILGEGIRVDNNSTVEYDPALQSTIYGLTKEGGWQALSFEEF